MSQTDKQSEFEYNSIDYGSNAESLTDSKKLLSANLKQKLEANDKKAKLKKLMKGIDTTKSGLIDKTSFCSIL